VAGPAVAVARAVPAAGPADDPRVGGREAFGRAAHGRVGGGRRIDGPDSGPLARRARAHREASGARRPATIDPTSSAATRPTPGVIARPLATRASSGRTGPVVARRRDRPISPGRPGSARARDSRASHRALPAINLPSAPTIARASSARARPPTDAGRTGRRARSRLDSSLRARSRRGPSRPERPVPFGTRPTRRHRPTAPPPPRRSKRARSSSPGGGPSRRRSLPVGPRAACS
jgi:hypothetical protein